MHRHTARADPRHQGGEGVAGTPGACSQVFCHPIRCISLAYMDRHIRQTHRQNHHHHHFHHHTLPTHHHHQTSTLKRALFFCGVLCAGSGCWPMAGGAGAAKRRRERRLRSWAKHERLTVAMALAEQHHHSANSWSGTQRYGAITTTQFPSTLVFSVSVLCR